VCWCVNVWKFVLKSKNKPPVAGLLALEISSLRVMRVLFVSLALFLIYEHSYREGKNCFYRFTAQLISFRCNRRDVSTHKVENRAQCWDKHSGTSWNTVEHLVFYHLDCDWSRPARSQWKLGSQFSSTTLDKRFTNFHFWSIFNAFRKKFQNF